MDTPVEIESFPVKDLPDRYSIGRTILYERMNALNITPERQGNRGYITLEQLNLLDDLDKHIKSGQTTPEFLRQHGITSEPGVYNVRSVRSERGEQMENGFQTETAIARRESSIPTTLVQLPEELIQILALFLDSRVDPFHQYDALAKAAREGYYLPTSMLLPLLSRKSIPKLDDHDRFKSMGFVFWKLGKIGNQYQWKITKDQ